ncbi:cytidylate kinase-like family protein [Ktedonosporobacter rubrisoli]|uniref:Cytidylate kinase-like family protein n=1 Tax=Ktedonosporobacter rubrisoli TaxID=2509675 RepID=A0A4P6JMM4_KTERU|nr:cytidylate kinase-like family protein [Ktedonosporobacter rubrisoli]QBD76310.1 cytidylate kinase-like family protein [Ktedonosporobacter rubrisoli]
MDEQLSAAMQAITISREYGSGGGEIARRLAHRLGWQLVDHQIIAQAARELHIAEAVIQAHDEKSRDIFSRLIQWPYPISSAELRAYHERIRHIVLEAAHNGHAVIVGRGGQVLLAEQRGVLHVRVVAPLAQRIAYVAYREGLDTDAAQTRIQEKDHARAHFMQTEFHCQHTDPHLYDLILNTAVLDLDSCVELICLALERKASRLNVPAEELGPATGMPRYPGKPADFPASADDQA